MSDRTLIMGQRSEDQRGARREIIRLLRKSAVYSSSVDEFISLREDKDAIHAISAMWDVMRDLRKAAKDLEALQAEPPIVKDKVPDVDPPKPETRGTTP